MIRYRLMLRRCLESPTPRFGVVMPPKTASSRISVEFGTMLEIRTVKMLPDGRSMVYTLGVSRFRILERGTLDGYLVGRVEPWVLPSREFFLEANTLGAASKIFLRSLKIPWMLLSKRKKPRIKTQPHIHHQHQLFLESHLHP